MINYAYFDDFKVTYTPTNILQYNEYYAHGAPNARSWTRDNTTTNNFLANGGTELNTTSQLYDLEYRNYDPILGRMNGVDPMADKYGSLTPYNYSFNSPTMHNDVSGADPDDHAPYWIEEDMQRRAYRYKGGAIDTYTPHNQFAGIMRTTPAMLFNEERSIGGWSPSSNSLMSYGGITGAEYSQMFDDARNLTPQEYGEKYGTSDLGKVIINELKTNLSSLMSDYRGSFGYWRQVGLAGTAGTAGIHIKFFSLTSFSNLTNGNGPGDWFGWFGSLFEKNYNGGVVYNGDALYGTNFIGPGSDEDPYKIIDKKTGQYLKPKDMVDAAAQRHDAFYVLMRTGGVNGALFNTRVTFADQILAGEASKAFFGYFRGDTDPITGNAISPRTRDIALDVMISFGLIGGYKSKLP